MDLATLVSSSCRRRILQVLSRSGQTNVMDLVRKVNGAYNHVNLNLQILREEGIIYDERFGRMRLVRLNKENPRTLLLLQALNILEARKTGK
ncbi:MAG: winged helix-turn-helix domain-containing protein [Candidatus Bathyarchaeia archaeon]